jgi:hypothetical protein
MQIIHIPKLFQQRHTMDIFDPSPLLKPFFDPREQAVKPDMPDADQIARAQQDQREARAAFLEALLACEDYKGFDLLAVSLYRDDPFLVFHIDNSKTAARMALAVYRAGLMGKEL